MDPQKPADFPQADEKGRTKVKLGDGTKFLCFSYKGIKAFETKYREVFGSNVNFLTFFQAQDALENMSMSTIVILVWAGLVGARSKFTYEDVEDLIDVTAVPGYVEAIYGAAMWVLNGGSNPDLNALEEEAENDELRPTDAGATPAPVTAP